MPNLLETQQGILVTKHNYFLTVLWKKYDDKRMAKESSLDFSSHSQIHDTFLFEIEQQSTFLWLGSSFLDLVKFWV